MDDLLTNERRVRPPLTLRLLDSEKFSKLGHRVHHCIGTRRLVLARRRRARIDADARHAHRVRALHIVKAIADHHGVVGRRAQSRQRISRPCGGFMPTTASN